MKKLIVTTLILLFALILYGCTQNTILQDYRILEREFRDLKYESEATITSETTFELDGIRDAIINVTAKRVHVNGWDEFWEKVVFQDQNGRAIFEYESIVFDGNNYQDFSAFLLVFLEHVFENYDISPEDLESYLADITPMDILGGSYTHVKRTGRVLESAQRAIETRASLPWFYDVFSDDTLEEYLQLDNHGVFRIEMDGDSVEDYLDYIVHELAIDGYIPLTLRMVTDEGDAALERMEDGLVNWLLEADFTDASINIEHEKVNELTFHRKIKLFVPDRLSVSRKETIVVGESRAITAPSYSLPSDEFVERTGAWIQERILLDAWEVDLATIEESPFNFEVWGESNVAQIERDGIILAFPIPPNVVTEEASIRYGNFALTHEDSEDLFAIQISLRDRMEGGFREYYESEIRNLFEFYDEHLWLLDFNVYYLYSRYEEEEASLIIAHWDDGVHEGVNFVKISQYRGALLLTELRFENVENRDDFFEAYGFMDDFGLTIRLSLSLREFD